MKSPGNSLFTFVAIILLNGSVVGFACAEQSTGGASSSNATVAANNHDALPPAVDDVGFRDDDWTMQDTAEFVPFDAPWSQRRWVQGIPRSAGMLRDSRNGGGGQAGNDSLTDPWDPLLRSE